MQKGFDLELIEAVSTVVPIPVIAAGGMGTAADFLKAVKLGKADAVAVGSVLHYQKLSIGEIKQHAGAEGINVRCLRCEK